MIKKLRFDYFLQKNSEGYYLYFRIDWLNKMYCANRLVFEKKTGHKYTITRYHQSLVMLGGCGCD